MGIFSQLVLRVFPFGNHPDDVLMEKLYLKASKLLKCTLSCVAPSNVILK